MYTVLKYPKQKQIKRCFFKNLYKKEKSPPQYYRYLFHFEEEILESSTYIINEYAKIANTLKNSYQKKLSPFIVTGFDLLVYAQNPREAIERVVYTIPFIKYNNLIVPHYGGKINTSLEGESLDNLFRVHEYIKNILIRYKNYLNKKDKKYIKCHLLSLDTETPHQDLDTKQCFRILTKILYRIKQSAIDLYIKHYNESILYFQIYTFK